MPTWPLDGDTVKEMPIWLAITLWATYALFVALLVAAVLHIPV